VIELIKSLESAMLKSIRRHLNGRMKTGLTRMNKRL